MIVEFQHAIAFGGLALTILSSVAGLAWWLSTQFSSNRSVFYKGLEKLETKVMEQMDKHEEKDESRYTSLGEQIKQIQLRNAAQDARQKKVG